jgi:hypothetical protein
MDPNQKPTPKNRGAVVGGIIIVLLIVAVIVYAAVRHTANAPLANTVQPIPINQQPAAATGTAPVSGQTVPESFTITGLSVVEAQSFPYQVTANVAIDLAETCSSATGTATQNGKTFTVAITATKPAGAVCGQIVAPQTVSVSLPVAGLNAGTYTVKAGTFSKTFTLAQNNEINYSSGK